MTLDPNAVTNAAPPQTAPNATVAPNPTPAPPDVNNASAPPTAGPLPAATPAPAASGSLPAAPTQPAPSTQNQKMPPETQHGMIGKIFQTIAGGQTTDYANTPNGPVAVKRDLKPGEMARNILGAAFSLMAAGAGGAEAGNERRGPYQQPQDQTIGGMEKNRVQQREQEAQKEFQNKQTADEATLRAHKDAMEQQTAIAQIQKDADEHRKSEFDYQQGVKTSQQSDVDRLTRQALDYDKATAMPGAEVMKDAKGQEINFYDKGKPGDPGYQSAGQQAQAYAVAHPEIIHGSTNGNTKYGVIPVLNPYTGALQFVDYPADRHDTGIANFGQKTDSNGEPVFDSDGAPVPDGTVLDPKTKKPTVLTQTVTPQQAQDIRKQNITLADQQSQILDRQAQARKYKSEADKNEDLSDATELYNGGDFDKMTDKQKQILARATYQQQTLASNREKVAGDRLAKAQQFGSGPDDPEVKRAQAEYDDSKSDYEDATSRYDQLTGNSPGIKLGNRIVRSGDLSKVKTQADWSKIDQQITGSGIPDDEAQKARAKAWNAMSPAQQAAASGKAAPTAGANPQATQTTPGARATIFDPQGNPHNVDANLVDQYLANKSYAGWHK